MKNVLLLRAPEENGPDRYEVALRQQGYAPVSVPVLETVLVHVDLLRDRIARGPDGLSGVILTSKRAVEAWCRVADAMPAAWRAVPFYVVGRATAAGLPSVDVRGTEAGTAERLAGIILAEGKTGRMLYLTGDKNRETLPEMLAAGGIALETLQVYRTTGSSTLRADIEAAMRGVKAGACRSDDGWWVVFFAPSAAGIALAALNGVEMNVAAIGPTTAAFLSEAGVALDVVAPRPTAESLSLAMATFDVT